jgi:cell division protein FtsZ
MAEITPSLSPLARIVIVGVGGAGNNAINRMIKLGIRDVDFVAVNADAQDLAHCEAGKKVNIGKTSAKGLGAGGNPELGQRAAEESIEDIKATIEGADMIFITAGFGGGTGTGAAPIVAAAAKEMGILTVGVVTKPFTFEGPRRSRQANEGLERLRDSVDTIIVIPNDRVLALGDKKTPLTEAFQAVDEILRQGIAGISDLITQPGLVNLDFADVRSVMHEGGRALMGIGFGDGENRAIEAARQATDSPLLEMSIAGAKNIIYNIEGGTDLTLNEVEEAGRIISESADPEAHVIFGATINDERTGGIKITVVAAGFSEEEEEEEKKVARSPLENLLGNRPGGTTGTPSSSSEEELEVPAFLRKPV